MSELGRVVATLVRSIENRFPRYKSAPFRVQEIHERLIPYRRYKGELGLDTNEYYELAIMRLLAGEGDYLEVPADVVVTLRDELASSNPDSTLFRAFGNVDVRLTDRALAALAGNSASQPDAIPEAEVARQPSHSGSGSTSSRSRPAEAARPATPQTAGTAASTQDRVAVRATTPASDATPGKEALPADSNEENEMASLQRSVNAESMGGKCRYCQGALPESRALTYCPHCGQDLTMKHCPACSTELEVGWKFCVNCGRSVSE